MDYSLFRDGTIAGFKLETKRRRHQSGLNVMAPKRIKNNDFATNLVPTERCLASWASQWSCYMFTWPLLSPASIIGEKSTPLHKLRMIYAISSKKKDWYMSTYFFLFFFVVKRERKGKGTYHCTAGQKIMFLCFSPQFLVLLKDLIWESPMEMGPQLSIHGHFLQLMGMIEPSINISNFWEIK